MEIMFGAKRFNRISIALSIETNSGMGRGDLANLTALVTADDQRSSRGSAVRPVPMPSAPRRSMRQLGERLGVRLRHLVHVRALVCETQFVRVARERNRLGH
jgi:hypothetical protein